MKFFWNILNHKEVYYFLLITTLAIFSFCNLHIFVYNCCIFLCYYIQMFPLCYFIGIFWHVFTSVNPFIHKYMALCVLKRNLIPEYLLSWFFFHGRCRLRPVTSASTISPVNIHITFYTLLQKDAYVCRIILRRRVLRKGMKMWSGFRMQRREMQEIDYEWSLCL